MNRKDFYDEYFKILVLLFWPIIWFKWVFLATYKISYTLFLIYLVLAGIYILLFTYSFILKKKHDKIVYVYRISTLVTFIFTLPSFLLYPKSLILLTIKLIFIGIYFYISCVKVYKYHMDEGVVGILSALLLASITIILP